MNKIAVVFQDLELEVIENKEHEWLIDTQLVAYGYGVSPETIRSSLSRNSDDLLEGKHYLLLQIATSGQRRMQTYWTKRGVIRLGFFIRSQRAKLFRDWAEDLIVGRIEAKAPATVFDMMRSQLDELENQSRRIEYVEKAVNVLAAKASVTNEDYYTISGYYSLRGRRFNLSTTQAQAAGKQLTFLSERDGYTINKVKSDRYGSVNSYHIEILQRYLGF